MKKLNKAKLKTSIITIYANNVYPCISKSQDIMFKMIRANI